MTALASRVKETSATTGTGSLTLAGAAVGHQTFNVAYGLNERFPYVIEAGSDWEHGIGYLSDSTTLVRESVMASSNAGTFVSIASAVTVFSSPGASQLRPASLGYRLAGYPLLS